MDRVLLNKAAIINRCVKRIQDTYTPNPELLHSDFDSQDIVILNLQRAAQAVIDMAMHIAKIKKLGIPQATSDVFDLLAQDNQIDMKLAESLKKMVGFRNIAVHEYTELDMAIVAHIIENDLDIFNCFVSIILKA